MRTHESSWQANHYFAATLTTMALREGTEAPGFELSNQFGQPVTLAGFRGKSAVALVFFPLAFSVICTSELCELRDNLGLFEDARVQLIGISVDSKATLRAWSEQEGYGFTLLADFWPHGEVARRYGVFLDGKGVANRATFVIDEGGVIRSNFVTEPAQARSLEHYRAALARLAE